MNADTKNMLRAGQLAKLADVSLPTIKHYVNEGLLPKPLKTGKTMAYYDRACVDRIKLIKKLQKEKFLPLDVIKRILASGSAYEEELELGQAILKSHKLPSYAQPVSESRIERHTRYPLKKIRLLEQEGLLFPVVGDGGKQYDAIDCQIIEIMKRREELGLPFDHSIDTVKLYRDAIEQAVQGDIRLFVKNLLGGFSKEATLKFLTEVDDFLDSFVVLIRQKMLRTFSQTAISEINELPQKLRMLSFLPIDGAELPESPPDEQRRRIHYLLCSGSYDAAVQAIEDLRKKKDRPEYVPALIIAHLLNDDAQAALRLTEQHIRRPTPRLFENTAAALAYLFSISETSGFSGPFYLLKKALDHLKRIETSREKGGLPGLFSRYICGAVYTILPDIFDTHERGTTILERIEKSLRHQKARTGRMPAWLKNTLDREILPALEVRVNRFLAEGYLRQEAYASARSRLVRLIEIADVGDEHTKWARIKRIEIRRRAKRKGE
jgi:DNA-binding transcriptional MerR regulator